MLGTLVLGPGRLAALISELRVFWGVLDGQDKVALAQQAVVYSQTAAHRGLLGRLSPRLVVCSGTLLRSVCSCPSAVVSKNWSGCKVFGWIFLLPIFYIYYKSVSVPQRFKARHNSQHVKAKLQKLQIQLWLQKCPSGRTEKSIRGSHCSL